MSGGIGNLSPVLGNNANQLMKSLQELIAQHPDYLKSGIPTHLIQNMWKKEPEPMQTKVVNNRIPDVCFLFY